MGLISVTDGAVFQFIDGEIGPLQFAGTEDAFNRIIKNELTVSSSAVATIERNSTLQINGLINNSGIVKHDYSRIIPSGTPTSSLTSTTEFSTSGSFISSTGNADHMVLLGTATTLYNYTVNYVKGSNSSNLVMIQSAAGISGQTQWSSSDAWASIQVVYIQGGTAEWIITSKVGNWY
jgi:hypothetical protein